jgi:trigger factor
MGIEISNKTSDGVGRTMHVSVPVEDVALAENEAARKYASRARIPGFRPGKAPPAVIRKKFGEAIRSEALESLVQAAYKEVVEKEQIKVAGQPRIQGVQFSEGKPLTFELHLEVSPEIDLSRVSGFRIKRPETEVSDGQVADQIEHLRHQKATFSPVEGRLEPSDLVKIILATSQESDARLSEPQEFTIQLGADQAIAAIEELILETHAGQTTERPVRWPDDFPDESQRGTTKTVRVTVLEAKRKLLPKVDDSFAREVGDFETLEELRSALRTDLAAHAQSTADSETRQKLLDEILAANPFDVPKTWVAQVVRGYAESYQIPELEMDKFAREFWPLAERQVRRELVVETIARKEGLMASEADIDARVSEVASRRNANAAQVYASLQKGGRMKELERGITEDNVFTWLLERNTVE